jgi:hypothetical protein
LGKAASLRHTLEDFAYFLKQTHGNPSHIVEIVGVDAPHIYGYTDACRQGMGGVILPATKWVPATVWRFEFPTDIIDRFDTGKLSINDLELAENFASERTAELLLEHDIAGLNSWFGSDNSATVSWKTKKATRAKSLSYVAPQILQAEVLLQRFTRRGPQDIGHIPGSSNLLGDFPSRSFAEHPATTEGDSTFAQIFSHRHPLPLQLGHWQSAHLSNELSSLICSLLRDQPVIFDCTTVDTGGTGPLLPSPLGSILSCQTPKPRPTTWNAPCCSWPLLSPYGKVDSTMASVFAARRLRERFASARSSWSRKDLTTLASQIQPTAD